YLPSTINGDIQGESSTTPHAVGAELPPAADGENQRQLKQAEIINDLNATSPTITVLDSPTESTPAAFSCKKCHDCVKHMRAKDMEQEVCGEGVKLCYIKETRGGNNTVRIDRGCASAKVACLPSEESV
ncbi:unnamed protein product, partial [Didymodactylos carnosus]